MDDKLPSPSRREPTDCRRRTIAAAARALIVEKGVEGLRTRDIADRVGINIATLHYHVPTKEALIGLVASSLQDEFMAQTAARPRAHLDARAQMAHELDDFRELMTERREVLLVFSELMERARRDERVAAAIRPMQRRWREIVGDILTKGVSEGAYRPDLDARAAAIFITGALISFCRIEMGDLDGFDRLTAELRRAIRHPDFSED